MCGLRTAKKKVFEDLVPDDTEVLHLYNLGQSRNISDGYRANFTNRKNDLYNESNNVC